MPPRLPANVPLSEPSGDNNIYASLVFACTRCWESDKWGFIAYNDNGRIYQIRRCFGEFCYNNTGEESKGKWITQKEQSKRTSRHYEQ